MSGIRVVVPTIPVVSALSAALSEEEDGGGPGGSLVLFKSVDSNRGSLGGESSAAKLAVLPIPTLEVEEVRWGNPVTRARREEPQRSLLGFQNSFGRRNELPYESQYREAVEVANFGFEEVANGEVAPSPTSGDELFESIIP